MPLSQKKINLIASQIGQMKKRLKGYQSPEPPESIAIEYAHNIQRIQKEVTIAVKRYILPVLEQYANK